MLTQTSMMSSTDFRAKRPASAALRTPAHGLDNSLSLIGAMMPFGRNTEIYAEDEPAEYIYKVVSGAVRTYKLLNDGRRQIGAFHLPGDVFGLEAGNENHFSAEAIVDSTILVVKRNAVTALAMRDSEVARELWTLTAKHLERAQDHMLLLGRKNAQERLAAFLLEMSKRLAGENTVDLPMSRQDIADYLGLTIETVSRTLTQLESDAAIDLPTSRRIHLRNRAALNQLNA
jgi:CRP/FNR family nitrogen fixation transcriptional regulator